MCTLGGAQSTAYPRGKSYVIGRLLGSRTHATASADDPCTMGIKERNGPPGSEGQMDGCSPQNNFGNNGRFPAY
jgi:hypothetical protein